MKKTVDGLAVVVGTICLILVLLYGAVLSIAFDTTYYRNFYTQNDISEETGLSETALERVTEKMLAYLGGISADMQSYEIIDNESRPVFNERELSHMADVRNLFLLAKRWALAAFTVLLLCVLWLIIRSKAAAVQWIKISIATLVGVILCLCLLIIWAKLDFTEAFTAFHHLFFVGDTWLFHRTDMVIRLMPLNFFIEMAAQIGLRFGLGLLCILAVQVLLYRRYAPKEMKS